MTDEELLAYRTEVSRLLAAVVDLEADRDRARDAAVALEQENARLTEELGQLRLDDEIEQRATALSPSDFDEPF
jgi:outer membrane murein-binding lipoprotein Lpp